MKFNFRYLRAILAIVLSFVPISMSAKQPETSRIELAADSGWKFFLGDPGGAEAPSYADSSWRSVDLPHDWSIESRPDKDNPSGSGGGFFPNGTAWYRKTFRAPADWKGKRVSVEFDGVYRDATVYLNGHKLGTHPYGYTAFTFDLTPELNFAGANVLAVRVDNSAQPNSRWYSGSGIYRHVRVIVTNPTHVAHWGVFITTPEVSSAAARISIHTKVANDSTEQEGVSVETTLFDKGGNKVGTAQSGLAVAAGNDAEAAQEIAVKNPSLWSPDSPVLYRAVSRVRKGGKVVDEVVTSFGIRSLAWSAEKGFLLNGDRKSTRLNSSHHAISRMPSSA